MVIHTPLVVVSDDVDVFRNPTAAERYIEPPEVRSGALRVFDFEGRPYKATVQHRKMLEIVRLEPDPAESENPEFARQLLIRFLAPRERLSVETYEPLSLDEIGRRALTHATA